MVTPGASTAPHLKLKTFYSRTLIWTLKEFYKAVTDFHVFTLMNLEMSISYENILSLPTTTSFSPAVIFSNSYPPSPYSLSWVETHKSNWEKRKMRKLKRANSYSLLIQLSILLSTNKVIQSGGTRLKRQGLVFKGFTICN